MAKHGEPDDEVTRRLISVGKTDCDIQQSYLAIGLMEHDSRGFTCPLEREGLRIVSILEIHLQLDSFYSAYLSNPVDVSFLREHSIDYGVVGTAFTKSNFQD